jgi:hypothetical protein
MQLDDIVTLGCDITLFFAVIGIGAAIHIWIQDRQWHKKMQSMQREYHRPIKVHKFSVIDKEGREIFKFD